ncbi:MAG: hypothetical protein ACR2HS_04955 [Gammaproteobacteria bacterium]
MAFGYVSINGESVKEETDIKTKQQLLEKEGAIVKDYYGQLKITGPFTISRQENNDDSCAVFTNSGWLVVEEGTLILFNFENSTEGSIRIKSGSLEDIFTPPSYEQYTNYIQRGKKPLSIKLSPCFN